MKKKSCRSCQQTLEEVFSIKDEILEFFQMAGLKTFDESRFLCQKCLDFTTDIITYIDNCRRIEMKEEIFVLSSQPAEEIVGTEVILETFEVYHQEEISMAGISKSESMEVLNALSMTLPRVESLEKQFICDHCGKNYRRKDSLKQHMISHRIYLPNKHKMKQNKIHTCHFCNAEFHYLSTCEAHVRAHCYEKPFQCDVCNKSYKKKDSLEKHKMMHDNERNFQCPICSSSFNRPHELKNHMKIHGERNLYSCPLCEAKYVSLANLKLHLKTIHEEKRPFVCESCGFAFRTKATMLKHVNAKTCLKKIK